MTVIITWDATSARIEAPTVAEAIETWRGLFAAGPATTDKKVSARTSNKTISTCSFSGELTRPALPDGHQPWSGGWQVVHGDTIVEVFMSDGSLRRGKVSDFRWGYSSNPIAVNILSYRKV